MIKDILKPKSIEEILSNFKSEYDLVRSMINWINKNDKILIEIASSHIFEPGWANNKFFEECCKHNKYKLVEIMLKNQNFNPAKDYNFCLRLTFDNLNWETYDVLMKDERILNNKLPTFRQ